jgi:putative hemolysin
MNEFAEVLLLSFSLLMSAIFSMSEAVLMTIPVERTRQLIAEGGALGKALQFLANKSQEILTTILISNNVINAFIAALTTIIAHRYFEHNAVSYSVGISSAFILVFGEITPKMLGRAKAEQLVLPVAFFLRICYHLGWVLVKPVSVVMLWILGKNAHLAGRVVTRDDIEFMVNQAEKEKTIDSRQIDLLNSILEFPTIKVRDIMVPRNKIQAIRSDATFTEIVAFMKESTHSRYPVYNRSLDDVVGFLHVKDLAFVEDSERVNFKIERYVKEQFFVYEHMKIQSVFEHMNRNQVHLALVKDENGVVVGVVTLEDIMEEIFGEIQDEHDTEEDGMPRSDGELDENGLIVSGSISLRDLYNEFDVKIPLNDNFSTLAGFVLDMLDNQFPKVGQIVLWDVYSFELTKVSDAMIEEVTIKEYSKASDDDDEPVLANVGGGMLLNAGDGASSGGSNS